MEKLILKDPNDEKVKEIIEMFKEYDRKRAEEERKRKMVIEALKQIGEIIAIINKDKDETITLTDVLIHCLEVKNS